MQKYQCILSSINQQLEKIYKSPENRIKITHCHVLAQLGWTIAPSDSLTNELSLNNWWQALHRLKYMKWDNFKTRNCRSYSLRLGLDIESLVITKSVDLNHRFQHFDACIDIGSYMYITTIFLYRNPRTYYWPWMQWS